MAENLDDILDDNQVNYLDLDDVLGSPEQQQTSSTEEEVVVEDNDDDDMSDESLQSFFNEINGGSSNDFGNLPVSGGSISPTLIGTSMYRGKTMEQAEDLYEFYKNSPHTEEVPGFITSDLLYTDPYTKETTKIKKPVFNLLEWVPGSEMISAGIRYVAGDKVGNWEADTSKPQAMVDAVGNQTREALTTVGAGIDFVTRQSDLIPDTNLAEGNLTKIFPKQTYNSNVGDALLSEIPGIVGSFFIGGTGGKKVWDVGKLAVDKVGKTNAATKFLNSKTGKFTSKVLKEVSPTTNQLFQFNPEKLFPILTGEIAAASVLPVDTQGLVFGEDTMTGIDWGFEVGDDPETFEKVLTARGNLVLDGLLAAGVITSSIKAAGKGVQIFNSFTGLPVAKALLPTEDPLKILGIKILDGDKAEIVRNVLNEITSVNPQTTMKEMEELSRKVVEAISQNKQAFIEMGGDKAPINVILSAMDALSLSKDAAITPLMRAKGNKINQGVIANQSSLMTEGAIPDALIKLESTLKQLIEEPGTVGKTGAGKIDAGVNQLVETINKTILKQEGIVTENTSELNNLRNQFKKKLGRKDAALTKSISDILELDPTKVGAAKDETRDAIIAQLKLKYVADKTKRDELFSAVKGGNIQDDAFINSLAKELDSLTPKQFELASINMPDSPFTRLVTTLRRRATPALDDNGKPVIMKNGEPKMELESVAERNDRVKDLFDQEGMDYAYLFNTVRKDARQLANDFTGPGGNTAIFNTFRGMVDWIDGKGLNLAVKATPEEDLGFKEAARAALEYMTKGFAPNWKDGALREFAELYDKTIARTRTVNKKGKPLKNVTEFGATDFGVQSKNIVESIIKSGSTDNTEQLVKVLNESTDPASKRNVLEYIIQDSLTPMYRNLKEGGIENFNIAGFEEKLTKYGAILKGNFPEAEMQLNTFVNRIRGAKGNKEQVEKIVEEAKNTLKGLKDQVLSNELGFFLSKNVLGEKNLQEPVKNGFEAFRRILDNKLTARNVIADLLERVKGPKANLVVREAMQTAYLKSLQDKILDKTFQSVGDNRPVTQSKFVEQIYDETNDFIKLGEDLFDNKPEVLLGLQELINLGARVTQNQRAKSVSIFSNTAFTQESKAAVNRIIYFTFGVLSKAGTRARTLASMLDKKINKKDDAYQVMFDQIMADPDEFVKIAREVTKKKMTDSDLMQYLEKGFFRGFIYKDTFKDEEDNSRNIFEQTEDLLQSEDIPYVPFI